MPTKKTTAKKAAKKSAKKPVKKAAKTAKSKSKVTKKTSAKKTVAVKPVTTSGVVTMTSVEDPGEATEGSAATVLPSLDKETGVITMVPNK